MLAAVNQQFAAAYHSTACERHEPIFDVPRQRRPGYVEAQLHRCGDLVDILAARPRGAHKAFFEVALVKRKSIGNSNHGPRPALQSSSS